MQAQSEVQNDSERLFLNSLPSPYTQELYKLYLDKYLQICGYKDTSELLSKDHKQIERELIEVIITMKERGMKYAAIMNYVKPVITFCKINDAMINTRKVSRFISPQVRSKKTFGYLQDQIQKLLDIADERMRAVILILSSTGVRIGSLRNMTVGNCEPVEGKDLYQITVYENEPEEYTIFCTTECKKSGIDPYLAMRKRYGEVITSASPLVREQFDRTDQFATAHPRRMKETSIAKKLTDLAEAAGVRTRVHLEEGQKAANVRNDIPVCNGFRRYYCKTLLDSGLQTEKRYLLEGHSLKHNDSSYLKVTPKDLLSQYLLAHDNLLISQEHVLREKGEKLEIERTEIQALALELEKIKKATGIE